MFFTTTAVFATLAASAAAKAGRTFAVNHFYGKGPLVEGRMDPIVSPGTAASHVHTIQGGNAFAETLGETTLMSSTCTSSLIKNDKSVYWTPKLYFHDVANGSFEDVPLFYMNVYYFFEATDDEIVPFPQGLQIFVGDPELRTPPAIGGAQNLDPANGPIQPIQFTCPRPNYNIPSYPADSDGMNGVGIQDPNNKDKGTGFPHMNCDGFASPLRSDIHFPSCYNPAAGLADYKNNMAWATSAGTTDGKMNCPKGYLHVPHMFYEVYWNTPLFVDRWTQGQGSQPFCLSNGDCTGYSLHADFVSGWDLPTLQQMIDNCDAGDAGMDKCPGLIGGINDASTSCNIESSVQETITGVLGALPGNNPITGAGAGGAAPKPPVSSGSGLSSSATAPASSGGSPSSVYDGGYGSSPSLIVSSSAVAPVLVQSTPSAAGGAASSPPSSSAPDAGYGSGSGSSASSPAAPVSSAPSSSPAGSNSDCGVTTVTTTMTVLYTASAGPSSTSPGGSSPTNPTIPSWNHTGCYSDQTSPRVLSGITFANLGHQQVTTSGCVAYCDAEGYSIAGTEFGGQCFCGDELASASVALAEDKCAMKCEGGGGAELCGGGLALTVYSKADDGSGEGGEWKRGERSHAHAHAHAHFGRADIRRRGGRSS